MSVKNTDCIPTIWRRSLSVRSFILPKLLLLLLSLSLSLLLLLWVGGCVVVFSLTHLSLSASSGPPPPPLSPAFVSKQYCSPLEIDHAVLIVGFGEEDGVKYWLIKNSWAIWWGDRGYYRIVRGVNACGVADEVTAVIVGNSTVS